MAKTNKPGKDDSSDDIEDILEQILRDLNKLPGGLGELTKTIEQLSSGIAPLISALTNLFAILGATTTALVASNAAEKATKAAPKVEVLGVTANAAQERTTTALVKLSSLLERMFANANRGPLALPGPAGAGGGGGGSPPGNMSAIPVSPGGGGAGAGSALAKIGAAGAVAAASLALLAITVNIVEQKFQQLQQSVRAFNPGVIDLFHQALANLSATIGSAFVPMFQVATEVVRQWTRVLAPVMQQLAPMVRQFSEAFGNILVAVLIRLGAVFQSLLPVIKQVAEFFQMFAEAFSVLFAITAQLVRAFLIVARLFYEMTGMGIVVRLLTRLFEALSETLRIVDEALSIVEVVINTLVDAVMAFFESIFPIRKAMEGLRSAVDFVIQKMYVFAVMLAKLAGMDAVVDALIAHVEGKLKPGATAAQQPQIKNLDQLTKDLALAAASAGGAAGPGGVRNQQEFWQRTLQEMNEAKRNGMSIKDILIEIKNALLKNLNPFARNDPPGPPNGAAAAAGGVIPGMINGIWGGRAAPAASPVGGRGGLQPQVRS